MTFLPVCNWDGHFWPKKKCLFYIAVGNGGQYDRWRLRFCPAHAGEVHEYLSERELSIANLTVGASKIAATNCFSCGQPVEHGGTQVFITGYPTQDERKDYWLEVHRSCRLPSHFYDGYSPQTPS